MTDATQAATPADPVSAAPSASTAPAGQSPLDVLDQILKDAQSKAAAATEDKSAEQARLIETEKERLKKLDEKKVQEELSKIEEMKQSPEYQAMINQKNDNVHQKEEYDQKMDGMQILQIQHKKV